MCLTPRLFLGEVLLLTLLASIIASSSIVPQQQSQEVRNIADGRSGTEQSQAPQGNYKYYSNRKGQLHVYSLLIGISNNVFLSLLMNDNDFS